MGERRTNGKVDENEEQMLDQQLGILFIEKYVLKLLDTKGRLAIILPAINNRSHRLTATFDSGLLTTCALLDLFEFPRRIFLKSNADLRSNILVAQKLS